MQSNELSAQQKKRLDLLERVASGSELALIKEIAELDEKIENSIKEVSNVASDALRIAQEANNREFPSERIIEKTEVIREQPIIIEKETIKETIKEPQIITKEQSGEQIVERINELPTDNPQFLIDASHIKNLPNSGQKGYHGASYLSTLGDVSIAGIVPGQSVRWNGTYWEAFTPSAGGGGSWNNITLSGTEGERTQTIFSGVTSEPTEVNNDGIILFNQIGYTYDSGAEELTFSNPPQRLAGWR